MANIRKKHAKFGQGGGRHSNLRRNWRPGRKTYQHCSTVIPYVQGNKMMKIRRKQIKKKYQRSYRLNQNGLSKIYKLYRSNTGNLRKTAMKKLKDNTVDGYRFVNLFMLTGHVSDISLHAATCEKAQKIAMSGGSPIILDTELSTFGLASILSAKCKGCYKTFVMQTSPKLEINRSSYHYDINVRAVWGSVVTGNGFAHLNEQLACTDSPGMTQKTLNKIESDINTWWKDILDEELRVAVEEEKAIAISKGSFHQGVPSITVICDGGWSKRTHKHSYNAFGGVAIIIGAETKKLLHIGVRNKYCYICQHAVTVNEKPKEHVCFKNWSKSSQAMESDIIIEGFLKADDYGVRYMNFIGDGDSSVFARIREEIPVWGRDVQKKECANHVVKCLRSSLEKLVEDNPSYKGKGKLTNRTRVRLTSAIRCSIRMRSKEENKKKAEKLLEKDILNSIHHIFGNHKNCSLDFCKAKTQNVTNNLDETDSEMNNHNMSDDIELMDEQANYWVDGPSLDSQEESREGSFIIR